MTVALKIVREDGGVLSSRCVLADDPFSRFKGLMGRSRLDPGEALFLATSSIQTTFMRFPIDAVFVDDQMRVLRVVPGLRPWRIATRWGAKGVVELEAGVCEREELEVGERLALLPAGYEGNGGWKGDGAARVVRIAVGTRDRRFFRVASFLLSHHGFSVVERRSPGELHELVRKGNVDVAIVDGSESLAEAARARRVLEALRPGVGVVIVADGNDVEAPQTLDVVAKWGPFGAVVDAVEQSYLSGSGR